MAEAKIRRVVEIDVQALKVQRDLKKIAGATQATERRVGALQKQFAALGSSVRFMATGFITSGLTKFADAAKDLDVRLGSVAQNVATGGRAFEDLLAIANKTGVSIVELGAAYTKLGVAVPEANQEQLLRTMDTLSTVLSTTGASTQQVNAVLLQMSQALASGALQGDEFRSVYENAPVLLRAWQEAIGRTNTSLRDLSSSAALTTESFLGNIDVIRELATGMTGLEEPPLTVGRAIQVLQNNFISFLRDAEKATPVFTAIASAIKLIADNLDILVAVIAGGVLGKALISLISFGTKAKGLSATLKNLKKDIGDFNSLDKIAGGAGLGALVGGLPGATFGGFAAIGASLNDLVFGMDELIEKRQALGRFIDVKSGTLIPSFVDETNTQRIDSVKNKLDDAIITQIQYIRHLKEETESVLIGADAKDRYLKKIDEENRKLKELQASAAFLGVKKADIERMEEQAAVIEKVTEKLTEYQVKTASAQGQFGAFARGGQEALDAFTEVEAVMKDYNEAIKLASEKNILGTKAIREFALKIVEQGQAARKAAQDLKKYIEQQELMAQVGQKLLEASTAAERAQGAFEAFARGGDVVKNAYVEAVTVVDDYNEMLEISLKLHKDFPEAAHAKARAYAEAGQAARKAAEAERIASEQLKIAIDLSDKLSESNKNAVRAAGELDAFARGGEAVRVAYAEAMTVVDDYNEALAQAEELWGKGSEIARIYAGQIATRKQEERELTAQLEESNETEKRRQELLEAAQQTLKGYNEDLADAELTLQRTVENYGAFVEGGQDLVDQLEVQRAGADAFSDVLEKNETNLENATDEIIRMAEEAEKAARQTKLAEQATERWKDMLASLKDALRDAKDLIQEFSDKAAEAQANLQFEQNLAGFLEQPRTAEEVNAFKSRAELDLAYARDIQTITKEGIKLQNTAIVVQEKARERIISLDEKILKIQRNTLVPAEKKLKLEKVYNERKAEALETEKQTKIALANKTKIEEKAYELSRKAYDDDVKTLELQRTNAKEIKKHADDRAAAAKAELAAQKATQQAAKESARLERERQKSLEETVQDYERLLHSADALSKADDDREKSLAALNRAIKENIGNEEEYAKIRKDIEETYNKEVRAIEEAGRATDVFGEKIKTAQERGLEFARSVSDAITNQLADAFYKMFTDGIDSAKDFFKNLGNIFKRELANLAAQLLRQTLVVPITTALIPGVGNAAAGVTGGTGAAGVGGTGATGGLGSLGGLGNLTSFLNPFSKSIGQSLTRALYPAATELFGSSQFLKGAADSLASTSNLALAGGGLVGGIGSRLAFGSQFDSTAAQIGNAIGSTAGAIIGQALIPIPGVGAAIGSFVGGTGGGFLGRVFGSKKEKPAFVRIVGAGGQLRISESRGAVPKDLTDAISGTNKALKVLVDAFSPEAQQRVSSFNSAAWGGSPRYTTNAGDALYYETLGVLEAAAKSGDELAEAARAAFVSSSGNLELAMQAVQELAVIVEMEPQLRDALKNMGIAFKGGRDELFKFVDSLGGVETALAAISEFESVSLTAGDILGKQSAAFRKVFVDDLGYSAIPDTMKRFEQITRQFYNLGQAGAENAVKLSLLSEEMASFFNTMDSLEFGYFEAFKEPIDVFNHQIQTLLADTFGGKLRRKVPETAEGFEKLVDSVDRSTEAGEKLYWNLLAIAPEMKAFYDGLENAGLELTRTNGRLVAVVKDVGDVIDDLPQGELAPSPLVTALAELRKALEPAHGGLDEFITLMRRWGVNEIPTTTRAMLNLINSGTLTSAEIIELSKNLDLVNDAIREMGQVSSWIDSLKGSLSGAESFQFLSDTMRTWGVDIVPQTTEALYNLIKSGRLTQEQIIELYRHQNELGAAFGYVEEQQRLAIDRLNDSLSELSSIVSSIDSAIGSFAEVQQDVINLDYERARQQLAAMAGGGRLPQSDELQGVLDRLTAGAGSRTFQSAREEGLANARVRADLKLIGDKAQGQLSAAERQVAALERMQQANDEWRDKQIAALDRTANAVEIIAGTSAPGGTPVPDGTPSAEIPVVTEEGGSVVGELVLLRKQVEAQSKKNDEMWEAVVLWGQKLQASTNSQELTMRKWDKDGLPPPRDLTNDTVNIVAMQGR